MGQKKTTFGSYRQTERLTFSRRGVVVITTSQLHSTKPELRFCAGSNPARGVLGIRDGEDLYAFRRSTIPQKQFKSLIKFDHKQLETA